MSLSHEAFLYERDEEFVAVLWPFLAEGLRRGEGAVVAVTAYNIGLLRDALGADAGAVTFLDRDTWYARPAATIAGWTGLLRQALAHGRPAVRIVGEVQFGSADRHDTWSRYESAVNAVFADAPARIICPYDRRRLPERVVAGASRTHPMVRVGRRRPSDAYQEPRDLLRTLAEPLPPVGHEPLIAMSLSEPTGPREARRALRALAAALRWDRPRTEELLLVTNEIAVNSLRHGGDGQRLDAWIDQDTITCDVTDHGSGPFDPLAAYRPPRAPERRGVGLWLANQLSDWLAIEHHNGVNRVRFQLSRSAPA
jgi:anti-sigma regulatory factor (Ser/Thr protein kinase)